MVSLHINIYSFGVKKAVIMLKDRKKLVFLIRAAVLIAVGIALFFAGKQVGAATGEPGSQSDPLVTLSYLEKRLKEGGATTGGSGGSTFSPVSLSSGDRLTLDDGGEAVVVRGNGVVFGEGLISLTGGEMFKEGTNVVLYADYLAAGTGSGIKASGVMKVYVKGTYTVGR